MKPQLSAYVFAVFFRAARLHAEVEPSHCAVLPARQEGVGVVWYRHNLPRQKGKVVVRKRRREPAPRRETLPPVSTS